MLNLNVGILGHVDSGKTTLAKVLSEVPSTAAFDKNPQSQQRGITLDLGFSSFTIDAPEHLRGTRTDEKIQFTLVDCPGHASLIRTVIGGAQIIDMMLLVVDVIKGIQTQTAECIVIGEITCKHLIIVLNKTDLIEECDRAEHIAKMEKRLKKNLRTTSFANSPIVAVSAKTKTEETIGISDLISKMGEIAFYPERNIVGPFVIAIDHCFGIKGKGTILTGTVLQGSVKLGDEIELPTINTRKKVKSIQMFRKPVNAGSAGDRLGLCVTQFDPKLIERGIACKSGSASYIYCGIIPVHQIKYFKGKINSKSKFHITVGYETVLATVTCFSCDNDTFDFNNQFRYMTELSDVKEAGINEYLLLEFEKPVLIIENSIIIGSRLDADKYSNNCRLAFWGSLISSCKEKNYDSYLCKLKIYKQKSKTGIVERVVDENSIIVKYLFKKHANIDCFKGLRVTLSTGENGIIENLFARKGKVKVYLSGGLVDCTSKGTTCEGNRITVTLLYKKFVYGVQNKIVQ